MGFRKAVFINKKGQKLIGILHTPPKRSSSMIIMVHGFYGDKDEQGLFVNAAKEFCSNGYNVLRFDCAGNGESDGRSRDITRKSERDDLISAIRYARSIGMGRIGVLGFSLGAGVAIIAYRRGIKAMCLWSASSRARRLYDRYKASKEYMSELREKGYFTRVRSNGTFEVGRAFMNECLRLALDQYIMKIKCPVLVVHGTKDGATPPSEARRLYGMLKTGKRLVLINGSGHRYETKRQQGQAIRASLDWFERYL
ncbi:MAG: alpha/beta hydrolase [Candidatus Micrarchaeota archaeon]|nr:alpha/beta hydrolase [Candidatus Micrarchaeota archaeon]